MKLLPVISTRRMLANGGNFELSYFRTFVSCDKTNDQHYPFSRPISHIINIYKPIFPKSPIGRDVPNGLNEQTVPIAPSGFMGQLGSMGTLGPIGSLGLYGFIWAHGISLSFGSIVGSLGALGSQSLSPWCERTWKRRKS